MNRILAIAVVVVLLIPMMDRCDQPAAGQYGLTRQIQIGGDGRWDYLSFDPASRRLFVPRTTYTQVIDVDSGQVVGKLSDTPGVHGVALATDLNRGFTSNGKGNSVTVFDLKSLAVLGVIPVGNNPDSILYESASKRVYACNGRSGTISVIDAAAAKPVVDSVVATITVGGKLETPALDGSGKLFIAIEDRNSIGVIDTKTNQLIETWKLDGGEEPSGLAIDVAHHRLYAGCGGNDVMAVVDTTTGKTLTILPIGKGVDACGFDPGTGEAFASCGEGTLTVIKETKPGQFEVVEKVKTQPGARTMTVDKASHTIYLPTADMAPPADGSKRPTAVPGTFRILVVGRGA